MVNRLGNAASPYLRSHADNPVDWWEWGVEAFAAARERDVPVLVSIGYSSCHWCHVMARESFSDPEIAGYLNDNFVAIKVDREEHQDVDGAYMAAASAFTGNLGWPLNVFVTPDGAAFFAGTYWPPVAVGEHPGFRQVLEAVRDAWQNRRAEVLESSGAVAAALRSLGTRSGGTRSGGTGPLAAAQPAPLPGDAEFSTVVSELLADEDRTYGGFGGAPKFPVTPAIGFLLDRESVGDAAAGELARRTLDAMAASALHDRVDGGFFRYATRRDWTEPHYERMLYDNAQLLGVYARAGRGDVAGGIANFLIGTLQLPSGGFASAQDSESMVEGRREEGVYYLSDAAARAALPPPPLDDKVLTGWNGLVIEALCDAGVLLGRPDWIAAASRAAEFVLAHHVGDSLTRSSVGERLSNARATLEDYGMLANGLLALAFATGTVRFALAARALVDATLGAATSGAVFRVPGGGDPVLASQGFELPPESSDGAHPSGVSATAKAALALYRLTAHESYRAAAAAAMAGVAPLAVQRGLSYGSALSVMSALARPAEQLVVVTADAAAETAATAAPVAAVDPVASAARTWQRVGATVAVVSGAQAAEFAGASFDLFAGRTALAGATTAYYCTDFVCRLPITAASELEATLRER